MVKKTRKKNFFHILQKAIIILIGMFGIRLDEGKKILLRWIPLAIIFYLLSQIIYTKNLWLPYLIFGWIFYFVGNSLILGTPIHFWIIKKFGKEKAYFIYEILLGLMFMNMSFAITQLTLVHMNTLSLPNSLLFFVIGALIFIISFGTKFWSTFITGLDTYYYKDLFLNEKTGKFVKSGPYKIFKNPMYGVGNVYPYILALFAQSKEGFIFAGIYQISIYTFYYLIEKPFVIRTYLSSKNTKR